jgi:hypothetical protein
MATSRRSFLKQGTLMAVAAGIPAGLARKVFAEDLASTSASVPRLRMADFAAQVNTVFRIHSGRSRVALRLFEVTNLARGKNTSFDREAFMLSFRGDRNTPLAQETYVIEHQKLGRFSFLVVPVVSKDQSSRHYEVVVNRLHG